MIRCAYCGVKNKDAFEYCVRCSEPLDLAVRIQPSPFRFFVLVVAVGLVAAAAFVIWERTGPSEEAPIVWSWFSRLQPDSSFQ